MSGAEAATEEAAAAVIMTCFVVGVVLRMLCFWFGGGLKYTGRDLAPEQSLKWDSAFTPNATPVPGVYKFV